MVKARRRWSLEELDAKWIEAESRRYNVALSFVCPVHHSHRLIVRMLQPYDGDEPIDGPGVWVHVAENGSIANLTLIHPSGGEDLEFDHCGRMRIISGHVDLVR